MPVVTAAIHRTARGRWRAVNMMSSAPTKGDHVMIESSGTSESTWRVTILPPHLDPDDEEQQAERDAVDVVLRPAALYASQGVATAQRESRQHIEDTVHEVAVDPADQPREPEDESAVEAGVERVEPVAPPREIVDRRQGGGDPGGVDRAPLVHRPCQREPDQRQADRERREPGRRLLGPFGSTEGQADAHENGERGEDPERSAHQPRRLVRVGGRMGPREKRDED